ncbi:MAG: tannase/feruloyl esterase family alpha/beta hydrolase [Gammaproteobacteria bacterium]|nr:tannase/feruloyl esterase family alpha/beta hydrolase [Gammaproteobacteria bacterium]
MLKTLIKIHFLVSGLMLISSALAQSPNSSCLELSSMTLPNGLITSIEFIEAGTFDPPAARDGDIYENLPDLCRVSATLSPVEESAIQIEVWLPAENWNNRLVAVGNGGLAGSISYSALAEALLQGYAAVSTNTGHVGGTPEFLLSEARLSDFAHRAVHEMTLTAKQLVNSHYQSAPRFTYFNGCSTGGRQALTAAQRYPQDFDGIIAGAPANSTVRMTMQQLWNSRIVNDTPGLQLDATDFENLHASVMASCDALDGLRDGIIENPATCPAEPADVLVLNQLEIEAIQKIYQGAVNPDTGEVIFPGFAKGSELGWTAMVRAEPFGYSSAMQAYVVNQDPDWDFMNLDFSRDLSILDQRMNALGMQAIDPDITDFIENGGKLLLYHGWNDPLISPFNSINYYNEVLATTGNAASDSVRLFMMPAVNHCSGGNGFDTWNKLQELDAWLTQGEAPERIDATRQIDGETNASRPLCAYPQVAVFTGNGNPAEATNFECR